MRAGTMVDKKLLLQRYENSLGSEGKTRGLYLKTARDFLDNVDDFSRDSINKYLRQLRKKKEYSDGTINFHFRVIRTLFNRNQAVLAAEGIEWPFRRGDAPQIREEAITAPALDPDTIITMINTIKVDGEPEEKAFLALSTTYGLRREELQELTKGQVNLKDRTLYIATKKHGRERTHIIPEDILPALEGYTFPTLSEYKLLLIWYRIEYKIGLEHIDQVGFHSIRRSLNTLLLNDFPETVVMSFLRWKQRTSSNMPFRYSAQKFVGLKGSTMQVVGESKDVDSKVFERHPFIKFWGNGGWQMPMEYRK
jgi:integrase